MKRLYSIIALLVVLMFYNCEDVIQVDTPQEEPRLIVEALIRVNYDSPMDPLQIKVRSRPDTQPSSPTPTSQAPPPRSG